MTAQSELLAEIEAFLRLKRKAGIEIAETTFGRVAVNDGKFVQRLRDDANVTVNTIDRVRAYIRDNSTERPPSNGARRSKRDTALADAATTSTIEADQAGDEARAAIAARRRA
jgi:hypothetical protein